MPHTCLDANVLMVKVVIQRHMRAWIGEWIIGQLEGIVQLALAVKVQRRESTVRAVPPDHANTCCINERDQRYNSTISIAQQHDEHSLTQAGAEVAISASHCNFNCRIQLPSSIIHQGMCHEALPLVCYLGICRHMCISLRALRDDDDADDDDDGDADVCSIVRTCPAANATLPINVKCV